MSDISQGPGWWQASDGKWYAPELYPKDWKPEPQQTREEVAESSVAEASDAATETPASHAASTAPVHPTWEPEAAADKLEAPSGWASPDPEPQPDPAPQPEPQPAHETLVVPAITPDPTLVQPTYQPPQQAPAAATTPRYAAPPSAPPQEAPPVFAPPLGVDPYAEPEVFDPNPDDAISSDPVSGVFALLGGALLIVASFMDWAIAGGTLTAGAVNGLTGSNGWGTLVCGLGVATCGALLFMGQRKPWVSGVMAVAALVGLGLAIFSYIDIGSTSDDLTALLLETEPPVDLAVAEGAELEYDTGMWIVLGGGVVSLIASGVAFARRQK